MSNAHRVKRESTRRRKMNWRFIIGVTVAGILCLIKIIVDRQGKKERELDNDDRTKIEAYKTGV